ncbi:MAG: hypothetical protein EOM66_04890 [Clostridia bacterium]|nr:hypothetical protein [Clostridia bacterium]
MRRFHALLLCIVCLFLLLGCAKEPEAVVIDVTAAGSGVTPAPLSAEPAREEGEDTASAKAGPAAEIRGTAAYILSCAEGPALYGAVAYENTGDAPLVVTKANFTFSFAGTTEEVEFTPIFADKTIVLPGETSYAVLWYTMADLVPGTEVRLSASLQWEEASSARIAIDLGNLYLAHNYPAFTSMAGILTAQADCPCNLIYTAFYDESGNLLGVWYFTENAHLLAGEPKAFTTHMKELPLENLAEQTKEIHYFGIGME